MTEPLKRLSSLIVPLLTQAPAHAGEMACGLIYPRLLVQGAALGPAPANLTSSPADGMGHRRPVYRGLLLYCLASAVNLGENDPDSGAWRKVLRDNARSLEPLQQTDWPSAAMPASRGAAASAALWDTLALAAIKGDFASRGAIFARLATAQRPAGALLAAGASDNPETHWHHELICLHALTSFAAHCPSKPLLDAIERAAIFHWEQTQPDHATAQPWAMAAFALCGQTMPLAEQLLHAAHMQNPRGLDEVSLMLLADALYSLKLLAPAVRAGPGAT